jgi:peptide deformylase
MPTLLMFAPKTDPILREIMPEVQNFADPKLHQMIQNMCYSILPKQLETAKGVHKSAAGMAANQWGLTLRVFLYTPDGSEAGNRLEIMINPSYTPYLRPDEQEPTMQGAYEGCFSIPLTTAIVIRYEAITAVYFTPSGEKVERVMEGWEARVFQHETDHLDGKLFDGKCDHFAGPECIDRIIFKDAEEMENFWVNKVRPSRA